MNFGVSSSSSSEMRLILSMSTRGISSSSGYSGSGTKLLVSPPASPPKLVIRPSVLIRAPPELDPPLLPPPPPEPLPLPLDEMPIPDFFSVK